MPGASLKDLSFETLVRIVSFYPRPVYCSSSKELSSSVEVRNLSLVCRAFNDACSVHLFRHYRVELGGESGWDAVELAKARISVVVRKAPHIRTLSVVVCDTIEKVMQDLISAMRCATGVTDLVLFTRSSERRLSKELVAALASGAIKPRTLSFNGEWTPPEQPEIIENIQELHLSPMSTGNIALTTFFKAPELNLHHSDNVIQPIAPFKLTQHDTHLKNVYLELSGDWRTVLYRPEEKLRNVFDFSQVPFVDVAMDVSFGSHYYWEWMETRDTLSRMFADDLRTFNVEFDPDVGFATIRIWRTKGEDVVHQDHLMNKKRDEGGLGRDDELEGYDDSEFDASDDDEDEHNYDDTDEDDTDEDESNCDIYLE